MIFTSPRGAVFYGEKGYAQLDDFLLNYKASKTFILVDANTNQNCLARFLQQLSNLTEIEIIEIEAGEEHKHLHTCIGVWESLSELGGDRKSLMINLGGGVVTDLGGFVASAFKRGIPFINVPTSLLAMVDASVGGKNGVDLGKLKNQIGIIRLPEMVLIDSEYLQSLPANEMRSGLAEILKHGLIASENYWKKATNLQNLSLEDLDDLIRESVEIKSQVVIKDPEEKNERKTLNFGHTLGHAIESYFLEHKEKDRLLHGEAIAVGMILAAYLSVELKAFPKEKLQEITEKIIEQYGRQEIKKDDIDQVIDLLKHDKKNEYGKINFVLLEDIGRPVVDCEVPNELIYKAFEYYGNARLMIF